MKDYCILKGNEKGNCVGPEMLEMTRLRLQYDNGRNGEKVVYNRIRDDDIGRRLSRCRRDATILTFQRRLPHMFTSYTPAVSSLRLDFYPHLIRVGGHGGLVRGGWRLW